jgi:hypothetical protein
MGTNPGRKSIGVLAMNVWIKFILCGVGLTVFCLTNLVA